MSTTKDREKLVIAMYSASIQSKDMKDVDASDIKDSYILEVLETITSNLDDLDKKIDSNLNKWKVSRVGYIEKAIIRIAAAEILYFDDQDDVISISEAVKLTNKYCDVKSTKLLNGSLNSIKDSK